MSRRELEVKARVPLLLGCTSDAVTPDRAREMLERVGRGVNDRLACGYTPIISVSGPGVTVTPLLPMCPPLEVAKLARLAERAGLAPELVSWLRDVHGWCADCAVSADEAMEGGR